MINEAVVTARLERLREYLKILKQVRQTGISEFKNDPLVHGAAERYLQLAIECLLDIGNHVIADRGLPKPESYSQILPILAREQLIPAATMEQLEGMAAFRNLLVHDYLRLDLERVYQILQEKLPHMEALGSVYAAIE